MRRRVVPGFAAAILAALFLARPVTAAEINDEQCATMREAARAFIVLNKAVTEENAKLLAHDVYVMTIRAMMALSNKPMTKELDQLLEVHNGLQAVSDAISAAADAAMPPTKDLVSLIVTVCPSKP